MDVKLLSVKSDAENWNPQAILKLVECYAYGHGVPVNDRMVKKYLIDLSKFEDFEIPEICFGTLCKVISEYCEDEKNLKETERWRYKAADYISLRYEGSYAKKLIEEYNLGDYLVVTP